MLAHASPIDSVGDALHIRKCVLDRIEDAEFTEVAAERDRLLTLAIVGSGQSACATAVELCQMLRTAEISYPVLRQHGWQVYLYEDTKYLLTDLEVQLKQQRDRGLEKAGVKLCRDDEVVGITHGIGRRERGATSSRPGGQCDVQIASRGIDRSVPALAI